MYWKLRVWWIPCSAERAIELHGVHRLGFNDVSCGVRDVGGRCPGEPSNPLLHEVVRGEAREGVPKTTKGSSFQRGTLCYELKGPLGEPSVVGPDDGSGVLVAIGEVEVALLLARGWCRHDAAKLGGQDIGASLLRR